MRCDTGLLRAYADAALAQAERRAVDAHLATCAACQAELVAVQHRASDIMARLSALEPAPGETSLPTQALARFRVQARPVHAGPRAILERRWMDMKTTWVQGRWRPLAVGTAVVACLLILFSMAPAPFSQAAADFLGIFRVRKFAVIPLDAAQQQKLEALAQQADNGRFGQPTVVREAGKPQSVADTAEAGRLAGLTVRTPATLPAGATRKSLTVQSGPAIHYEMDRAIMQALLDATQAQGVKLPAADKITVDVDVPSVVAQEYTIGAGRLEITQMASPQVSIPPGIDPIAIGEAGFKFLGMSDADARRLAQSIDWTSTLVIPIPTNIVQYREITVDGVTALLIEHRPGGTGSPRAASLLWQKDGNLYGIQATNVDPMVAIQVADSLR